MANIFVNLFLVVFAIIFIFIVGLALKAIYNSIAEKRYNDSQPILTKPARIAAKRTEITGGGKSAVNTIYYAAFEFPENKQRIELEIDGEDYGLMAEGDSGNLTFQGRRYHKFQRNT